MDFRLDKLEERAGALLARRASGVSLTELAAQYATDLEGFIMGPCQGQLMEHQRPWAQALQDAPLVAIATGHSLGKDYLLGRFCLWWAYCRGGLCLVTSTTQRQVAEQVFGEIARAFHRAQLPGDLYQLAV